LYHPTTTCDLVRRSRLATGARSDVAAELFRRQETSSPRFAGAIRQQGRGPPSTFVQAPVRPPSTHHGRLDQEFDYVRGAKDACKPGSDGLSPGREPITVDTHRARLQVVETDTEVAPRAGRRKDSTRNKTPMTVVGALVVPAEQGNAAKKGAQNRQRPLLVDTEFRRTACPISNGDWRR